MPSENTENIDKLKKVFQEISEVDFKSSSTYQEFLLKLHELIKHQYVSFSKMKKKSEENWGVLKEHIGFLEKSFERILLEKEETTGQLENIRNLLDEKIYDLTKKEDELEALLTENKAKEEKIEQLKKNVEELIKQVEELKINSVTSVSEEKTNNLNIELDEQQGTQIAELKENLQKVKNHYDELKQKYEEIVRSNNSLQEDLEKTQKELMEVLEQREKKINSLQLELEEKQREILQLKVLLEQSNPEERVKSLNEELEKNKEIISGLEKKLEESIGKDEYNQLQQELEKIRDEFNTLKREYQEVQKELNVKEEIIKENEKKVEDLQIKLNEAPKKEKWDSLQKELEEREKELDILKETLKEYEDIKLRYDEMVSNFSKLENENNNLLNAKKTLEEKIDILPTLEEWSNLQKEVLDKKDEINRLKEAIEREKAYSESLSKEKQELEIGVSSLGEKILELETEVVDLQKSLSDAPDKADYEKIKNSLETQQKENESLKNEIQKLSLEKQEYYKHKQALEKEVDELKEQIKNSPKLETVKSLEKQLLSVTAENKRLQQKFQELMKLKSLLSIDDINRMKEKIKDTFEAIEQIEETIRIGVSEQEKVISAVSTIIKRKKKPSLGEILLEAKIIDKHQLEEALNIQKQTPMKHLGEVLIEKYAVSEYAIAQSLASQCNVPFSLLTEKDISPDAINAVPARIIRQHNCIPIRVTERTLTVAITNPIDLVAIEDLEHASGKRVEVVVSTPSDIKNLIEKLVPAS